MSSSPIDRSPDLRALRQAGYALELRGGYLVVKNIPYLRTADGVLDTASLVTSLGLTPDGVTGSPSDHTVWWTGSVPYNTDGESMADYLSCGTWDEGLDLGEELTAYMQWSRKPLIGGRMESYKTYEEKIRTYIDEVGNHAEALHPGALETAKSGEDPIVEMVTRFNYINTGTYRYGVKGVERPIEDEIVAVIGVGGTGSYLVDVLAKTNVKELHLFDDDKLEQHNAFRLAGAAHVDEIGGAQTKVAWHKLRYSAIREQGVFAHESRLHADSTDTLRRFTTVFIAVDDLPCRRALQQACNELGVFHVSVGLAVEIEGEDSNQLGGMVKVETGFIPALPKPRPTETTPLGQEAVQAYGNVQTAELNMLGAALAITEWKAKRDVYRNERSDFDSVLYSSTTGRILQDQKGRLPS